jgi:hypothetical protein
VGSRQTGASRPNGINRHCRQGRWRLSPNEWAENRSPAQSINRAERARLAAPETSRASTPGHGDRIGPKFLAQWASGGWEGCDQVALAERGVRVLERLADRRLTGNGRTGRHLPDELYRREARGDFGMEAAGEALAGPTHHLRARVQTGRLWGGLARRVCRHCHAVALQLLCKCMASASARACITN